MSKESFKKNVEQLPRSSREEKANVLVASWHVIHELMTKGYFSTDDSVELKKIMKFMEDHASLCCCNRRKWTLESNLLLFICVGKG